VQQEAIIIIMKSYPTTFTPTTFSKGISRFSCSPAVFRIHFLCLPDDLISPETEESVVFPAFDLLLIKGYFTSRERTEHHHSHVLPGGAPLCCLSILLLFWIHKKKVMSIGSEERERESQMAEAEKLNPSFFFQKQKESYDLYFGPKPMAGGKKREKTSF
jgi:hypothetical protein